MFKSRFAASIAVAALLTLNPAAARAPQGTKAAIAKIISAELRKEDFSRHSQADVFAAIKPADINSDGVTDWQIDWNAFGSAWCGTGGCRYQLWLGQPSRPPRKVFDRQARQVTVLHRKGLVVYRFDFHGGECGGYGAEFCPGEFSWNAKRGRMVLLPSAKRHTAVADPIDEAL